MSDSEFEDELAFLSNHRNRRLSVDQNVDKYGVVGEEEEEAVYEEEVEEAEDQSLQIYNEEDLEEQPFFLDGTTEIIAEVPISEDADEVEINGLKVLISKYESNEEESDSIKVVNAVKAGGGMYMIEEELHKDDFMNDMQMLQPEILINTGEDKVDEEDDDKSDSISLNSMMGLKSGVVQRLQSSDGRFMLEVKKSSVPTVSVDQNLANLLNIPVHNPPKYNYSHKGIGSTRVRQPKPEYKCTECDYVAPNRKRLDEHNNVHSGAKPFNCTTCGKAFRQRGVLQLHMKRHSGQKAYQCAYCPFRGYSKTDVDRHVGMHTGLRAWVCEHCGKGFTSDLHLRTHKEAVHDRQREFRCKECDYWTYSRNALTGHVRGVHRPERVTHICPICGKKLKLKSSLFHHLRTHLPESLRRNLMETLYPAHYPCDKCNKHFADGKRLTQHKKQVHAEKKYSCESCGKCFTLKSKLKRHEIIHTTNRPHCCPHCSYSCNLRNNLIKHVRNVHNKSDYGLDLQSLKYREKRWNGRHKPVPDRADMLPTWIHKGEEAMKEFLDRLSQNTGTQFTMEDMMRAQSQVEQEKKEKLMEMRHRVEAKLEEKFKKQEQRERRTIEKRYRRKRKIKTKKDAAMGHSLSDLNLKLYEHGGAEAMTDDSEEEEENSDGEGKTHNPIVSLKVETGESHILTLGAQNTVVGEELVIEQGPDDGTLQVGLLADLSGRLVKPKEEQLVISYPNEPSDAGMVVVVDNDKSYTTGSITS